MTTPSTTAPLDAPATVPIPLHHHVMVADSNTVTVVQLSDMSGFTATETDQVVRLTQAPAGLWELAHDDERLPLVLANCGTGAFITDLDDDPQTVADIYTAHHLPVPPCVPLDELPELVTARLTELAEAEPRIRDNIQERTGKRPGWKPAPWPTITRPEPKTDPDTAARYVLQAARVAERCFDAWDEAESQRLRRKWFREDPATGGDVRQQVVGTSDGWQILPLATA